MRATWQAAFGLTLAASAGAAFAQQTAVAEPPAASRPAMQSPTPAAAADAPTSPSAAPLPRDVHWVRNSAEYAACAVQAFRLAGERLRTRAAGLTSGTWCVVLDADETVIDNSIFQKELAETGKSYSQKRWQEWCRREEAAPVPGAVAFIRAVQAMGGRVVIVTNRAVEVQAPTEAVFRARGIPCDIMMCRAGNTSKEARMKLVEEGKAAPGIGPMKIVLWVGDNIQDFPGGAQSMRAQGEAAFKDFGDSFIVLPNPMYGSWERNPQK